MITFCFQLRDGDGKININNDNTFSINTLNKQWCQNTLISMIGEHLQPGTKAFHWRDCNSYNLFNLFYSYNLICNSYNLF